MYAIESRKKKLDSFFVRASSVKDDELKSDLAKFGIVLICGYVERCVEIVILERLTSRAHPRVIAFVQSHFKRGNNYDCEAICQLLVRFDNEWSEAFRKIVVENDEWASSLSSAYYLRNSIAHGGTANKGLVGVMQYYDVCKNIIEALIESTKG